MRKTKGNLTSAKEGSAANRIVIGGFITLTLKESAGCDNSHLGSQYLGGRGKMVTKSSRLAWATV